MPVRGRETDDAGAFLGVEIWKRFGFRAAVGGVVTDVADVEKAFLGQSGKQFAVVAGQADEAR